MVKGYNRVYSFLQEVKISIGEGTLDKKYVAAALEEARLDSSVKLQVWSIADYMLATRDSDNLSKLARTVDRAQRRAIRACDRFRKLEVLAQSLA